ncbi:BtrH N-terminal domain-containing protein [Amycolatopsis anabasis]|uniref:BtrH N-terminal domain-containing protein n=1 Tax=Amycolatopsis anabasis TaxID=1840409 RepID=UPI00131E6C1B|nr:BtrH N-terminal domain-containing protein [Amycolatopsis anabasis]
MGERREYRLRGGRQADVAAVRNVLAQRGVTGPDDGPIGEPLVFLASGGIGAGCLLAEFGHGGSKPLLLGFRSRWQSPREWIQSTVDRLGVEAAVRTGGGTRKRLTKELAAGNPVLVLPDRYTLGYWELPEAFDGGGGHFVVAYAEENGRVFVDDRNLAPLTVERKVLDRARGRVGSYKNLLVSIGGGQPPDLAGSVRAGLADCVSRLSDKSTSFSVPAWGKWAKLLTDERSVKGWPAVFADRRGLVGALLSIWEGVSPDGMTGGHLRDLFADGLTEAAPLLELPALERNAGKWREIGEKWRRLGAAASTAELPEFDWMRGLTAAVTAGVRAGDEGRERVAESAAELWRLRNYYDAETPFTEKQARTLFTDLGERLRDIYAAERDGIAELAEITA